MIIGLALAVAAAAAMYVTLFRVSASAGPHIASHKAITFRRLVEFTLASAPDSVQLDPDGKIVVVVSGNGRITAWPTTNRPRRHSFPSMPGDTPGSSQDFNPPTFSPDGKEFSVLGTNSSGDEVADIWNTATRQVTSVVLTVIPSDPLSDTVLGPNGLIASLYSDGMLGIAEAATGRRDAMLMVHRDTGIGYEMGEPAFSPDGRTVAASDDLGKIYLVNVPRKHLGTTLVAEKIYNPEWNLNGMADLDIDSLTFCPDSKRVACATESGIIHVWNAATGRNVSAFNANGNPAGSVAARPVKTLVFSPTGKTLVTADSTDSTVAIWDTASGRRIATPEAGTGNVTSAAFTANGTLIVATTSNNSKYHRIEIWTTGQNLTASS